jgi:hypothetical protein
MDLKEKDVLVVIEDKISFGDSLNSRRTEKESPIKGHVQIYEILPNKEKKLIFENNNLVVYLGREWVASRILNLTNVNLVAPNNPTPDEFICWFGLGSGGTYAGDPFDPVPPSSTNVQLNSEVPFSDVDDHSELGDFRGGYYYKHILYDTTSAADIYQMDENNDNKYLIAKVQLEVGEDVANDTLVSEACLFTAASGLAGYNGPFHLFARVTFPSIYKSADRILFFVWYLYC